MGFLDFFKKKNPEIEKEKKLLNLSIAHLEKGYLVDYDLRTWTVTGVYEYDWGDNYFSKEYQLQADSLTMYLSVDEDDELELALMRKIEIRTIDSKLPEHIIKNDIPPEVLTYSGKTFYMKRDTAGHFRNVDSGKKSWSPFVLWEYHDESGEFILNVEQWGEKEFEAAYGMYAKQTDFTEILPGKIL